jgi:hypothetical protein
MKQYGAKDDDIGSVEAWAVVVKDLLYRAPPDIRAAILAAAADNEQKAVEKRKECRFILESSKAITADWENSPGIRHWHTVMRLKALTIQAFVRNITNNNSKGDAAAILFADQRHGAGSGSLSDYIDDLPRP